MLCDQKWDPDHISEVCKNCHKMYKLRSESTWELVECDGMGGQWEKRKKEGERKVEGKEGKGKR